MIEIVEPNPIYRILTEEEVWNALNDHRPPNRITSEVNRLVEDYTSVFHAYVARVGYVPPHVFYIKARWPIEKVAVEIVTQNIRHFMSA